MPTYEYACKACGHEFEREQRISDPPVRTCPECRKRRVERLISRTSFVLKGGGWYSDLYSSTKPDKKGEGKTEGGAPDAKEGASGSPDKGGKGKDKAASGSASSDKGGKGGKGTKAAAA